MKKSIKSIIALALIIVSVFTLSSCYQVEDIINRQAFWTDGSCSEIELNGKVYSQFPERKAITVNYEEINDSYGYVTEKGVPALLSEMVGTLFHINKEKALIEIVNNFYCSADKYDEYMSEIDGDSNYSFCLMYLKYDEKAQKVVTCYSELSDKETEIIQSIAAEENVTEYTDVLDYCSYNIVFISKSKLFIKEYYFDVYKTTDGLVLCNRLENGKYYLVPKESESVIKLFESICEY